MKKVWLIIKLKPIFCFLVILFLLMMSGCRLDDEKKEMRAYLNQKYGKKFGIERISYSGGILGEPLLIKGRAYAIDDKNLLFNIERFANLKYADKDKYNENYLTCLWSKQISQKLQHSFRRELVLVNIMAPLVQIEKEINGKTIGIDKALEQYGNNIELHITLAIFMGKEYYYLHMLKLNNLKYNGIREKLVKLNDKRFKQVVVRIFYVNKKFEKEVRRNPYILHNNSSTLQRNTFHKIKVSNLEKLSG